MLYDPSRLLLIAGPCSLESEAVCRAVAETLVAVRTRHPELNVVFKGSYDKANRTSLAGPRGTGLEEGLRLLELVRRDYGFPVLTDVHESQGVKAVAEVCDVVQIPAFLCRQTDLLLAAAATTRVVNVKKGQFLSPESMKFAIEKVRESGNENIVVTDRGTMFGYGDMVVDFRGIPKMQKFNVPVVVDCTHSLQQPNQSKGVTGGDPEMIETIARAAIAVGADGLFIETHPRPEIAKSDGANMLRLDKMESLIEKLVRIRKVLK